MPTQPRGQLDRRYVPGDGWEARVPRILSWICYGVAALSFITALIPGTRRPLGWLRGAVDLFFLAAPPNLAWAVLMVILASALGKRKRAAWGLLLVLECGEFALLIAAWAFFPSAYPTILTPLAIDATVIGLLLLCRREFFAISQKGNGWRAILTFFVGMIVTVSVGTAMISVFADDSLRPQRISYAASQFLGVLGQDPGYQEVLEPPREINFTLSLLAAITFIATAYVFFRSRRKTFCFRLTMKLLSDPC